MIGGLIPAVGNIVDGNLLPIKTYKLSYNYKDGKRIITTTVNVNKTEMKLTFIPKGDK